MVDFSSACSKSCACWRRRRGLRFHREALPAVLEDAFLGVALLLVLLLLLPLLLLLTALRADDSALFALPLEAKNLVIEKSRAACLASLACKPPPPSAPFAFVDKKSYENVCRVACCRCEGVNFGVVRPGGLC